MRDVFSPSDITKTTAGGESYIWLRNGWYKNRPLFDFSLSPCALPALYLLSLIRSSRSLHFSVPPSRCLPCPSFTNFSLPSFSFSLLLLHYIFFAPLSNIFPPFSFQFIKHFSLDHRVYIRYRFKRLGNTSLARLHSFTLLSPSVSSSRYATFTLTTRLCIPVIMPTHNLVWLIRDLYKCREKREVGSGEKLGCFYWD